MRKFELEVTRGDTIPLKVTVVRNGSALNIAGATFRFAGKQWLSDAVPLVECEEYEITSPTDGEVTITIPPEATASFTDTIVLNCDIEMIETDDKKTTVARGKLKVVADVA